MSKKIYIGSDHAGFALKRLVTKFLATEMPAVSFEDLGCHSEESVDYPNFADAVGKRVAKEGTLGILICGSGIGMSIAANKVSGIRAAECWDVTSARLSRQHNNANILCFGSRLVGQEVAFDMCRIWLTTEFLEGRHQKRIDLITKLEKSEGK